MTEELAYSEASLLSRPELVVDVGYKIVSITAVLSRDRALRFTKIVGKAEFADNPLLVLSEVLDAALKIRSRL